MGSSVAVAVALAWFAVPCHATKEPVALLSQPVDGVNAIDITIVESGGKVLLHSRAADDFELSVHRGATANIEMVQGWVAHFGDGGFFEASVSIYSDSGEGTPGDLVFTAPFNLFANLGPVPSFPGFVLYQVGADGLSVSLDTGTRYWIIIDDDGNGGLSYWMTSGNGVVNGEEAVWRSPAYGVPVFTPLSQTPSAISPTDLAFELFGTIGAGPPCLGDANGDLLVDFDDIVSVLGEWLTDYGAGTGLGDANFDGFVDFDDVVEVLSHWLDQCS